MNLEVNKIVEFLKIFKSQENHVISMGGLFHIYFPNPEYRQTDSDSIYIYRCLKALVQQRLIKCISSRVYDYDFLGFEYTPSGHIRIKNIHFVMTNLGREILKTNGNKYKILSLLVTDPKALNLESIPLFGRYIPSVGSNS